MSNIPINTALDTRYFLTRPLSSILGGEINNIDLACPLSSGLFESIKSALFHHKVIVFPNQRLKIEDQVRFSRAFGELQAHVVDEFHDPYNSAVSVISNLGTDGRLSGKLPDPGTLLWHIDGSWQPTSVVVTSLYAVQVPPRRGDTLFGDLTRAYFDLSPADQNRLKSLTVIHELDSWAAAQRPDGTRPATEHPLVRPHPITGSPTLFVSENATLIKELLLFEGRALLESLLRYMTSSRFTYRHVWQKGQLMLIDNCGLIHKTTPFDASKHARIIRRTSMVGESSRTSV